MHVVVLGHRGGRVDLDRDVEAALRAAVARVLRLLDQREQRRLRRSRARRLPHARRPSSAAQSNRDGRRERESRGSGRDGERPRRELRRLGEELQRHPARHFGEPRHARRHRAGRIDHPRIVRATRTRASPCGVDRRWAGGRWRARLRRRGSPCRAAGGRRAARGRRSRRRCLSNVSPRVAQWSMGPSGW